MRFKYPAAAIAAFSLASASLAEQAQPEFTADAFRAHVAFLADDLLEGRNAGTRGYDVAARYVATRFEALGLKPAANGGWYQQVPFVEYRLADAPARVRIGGKAFASGKEVVVWPTALANQQPVEAPIVFVGYGLDAPQQGFDDYRGLDVRGKIVAVLSGFPKGTPSEMGAHLSAEKSRMAEKRGALGTISIRTRAAAERTPWDRLIEYSKEPSVTWVAPGGQPFASAPGIRASATIDQAAAEALFEGAPRSIAQVLDEAAREGGKPKGFALKQSARIEGQSSRRTFSSDNVVAILPGSDPKLAGEYVVLMAHLDHNGVDPARQGDKIYNGAMDNATGVATMLEVARAMAQAPTRPRRSILFAAVTAEEDGLLGSQYLAKHPLVGNGKVVGVVNLDMPVLLYDFSDVIAFGAEHSTLGPIVARAGAGMNVKLAADPLPEEGLFTRSDHYRFVQEGVPSVFLMTGFSNGGQEKFTDFLKTHYHKPSDQISLPFNWQAGAKFARINYLIAREIANAPQAPLWYARDFFGDTFAPNAAKAPAPAKQVRPALVLPNGNTKSSAKENRGI